MNARPLALRPLLTRFLVAIALLLASLAWAGWVFLHSVGDPHRFEKIATSILDSSGARDEIADNFTDQLTNTNLLDSAQQTAVRGAVADALADPRIVDNFVAAFGAAQASALGIDDGRPATIDVGSLVDVLREKLAVTQPELAASIPIVTQTVELPKVKSNAIADARKLATTWTVWLSIISIASLVALFVFGDRRVVLRSFGFWAILTGAFWAIGPRITPWIARQYAPQADSVVKAVVDAVVGPITTTATILVVVGVIALILRFTVFRREPSPRQQYAYSGAQPGPAPASNSGYQSSAPMPHPIGAPTAYAPTAAYGQVAATPYQYAPTTANPRQYAPDTSATTVVVGQPPPPPGWGAQPAGQIPWPDTYAGSPQQPWPSSVPEPAPILLRPLDLPTSRDSLLPLAEADEHDGH